MPLDATQQRLDALLPQTQCQRCGYPGCAPYAAAMAAGEADINRCPPGGDQVIVALAAALRRPVVPLDPELSPMLPAVARIDASECIGCARCLPPCPVDAIVGARQFLHTVLAADCTGCELCLAACPVDCIVMEALPPGTNPPTPEVNRQRFERRQQREQARAATRQALLSARKAHTPKPPP